MKITTIITTYNHERFIQQAVESAVCQQGTGGHEVIVVDDCSTDATYEILKELQTAHPHLRLIRAPSNENSNRRVAGLVRACTAEYLAFLDGDDYWLSPSKLRRQIDYLDSHSECALCFHNALIVKDGHSQQTIEPYNADDQSDVTSLADLLRRNFIAGCSAVIRTDALRDLPRWYDDQVFGDWPLYILAARHGLIGYLPERLGAYRIHHGGIWSAKTRREQLDSVVAFLVGLNAALDRIYEREIHASIQRYLYKGSVFAQGEGDLAAAREYLTRATQLAALSTRPADLAAQCWRLWLLRHPTVYGFVNSLELLVSMGIERARQACAAVRRRLRAAQGRGCGRIRAEPNPIRVAVGMYAGVTTVSWTAINVQKVEIRIDTPDGPLFSSSDGSGSAETGAWVQDKMVFLLQDASDLAIPRSTTLARVRVRVLHTTAAS